MPITQKVTPAQLVLTVPHPKLVGQTPEVAVVTTVGGADARFTNLQAALQSRGYAVTHFSEGSVTSTNLRPMAAIVCIENSLSATTLVGLLNGYSDNDRIPIIVGYTDISAQVQDASPNTVAALLGLVANERRDQRGNVAIDDLVLASGFRDHPMTEGYTSSDQIVPWRTTRELNHVATTKTEVAGSPLVETSQGNVVMAAADRGDAKILKVGGTFTERMAYMGFLNGASAYGRDAVVLLGIAIEWGIGDYDPRDQFPLAP